MKLIQRLGVALAICATGLTAGAQNIHFAWGDDYKLPRGNDDIGFIGNGDEGYIQVGHDRHKELSFQKFDAGLHFIKETETDLHEMPRDYTSEFFMDIGGKHYWLFSTWERDDKTERLWAQEIDIRNAVMKGSAKEIVATSKLTGDYIMRGFYSFGISNKWHAYHSFDNNKLLIEYRKRPEEKRDSRNKDIIGFVVFDADLNKVWEREIRMPYTEEKMDNEDYQVDKDGNVYTLAKVFDGTRKGPYHFEILRWTAGKTEVSKVPFQFTDKAVKSVILTEDPEGKLVACGLYSNSKRNGVSYNWWTGSAANNGSADGIFILRVDPASEELGDAQKGMFEFPADVLKQFETKRSRKRIDKKDDRDEAEAQNLQLRKIVMNRDGSVQVYAEEYLVTVTTYYTSGANGMSSSRSVTNYYYDDILAMSIGADGKMQWLRKIPKQQRGTNRDQTLGMKHFDHGGYHYLFYMDNKKNLDIAQDESPNSHVDGAGGILMVSRISADGEVNKQMIFDVREEDKTLFPRNFDDVGPTSMIVRARAGKRVSVPALITFE